jgi:hypothetical protein
MLFGWIKKYIVILITIIFICSCTDFRATPATSEQAHFGLAAINKCAKQKPLYKSRANGHVSRRYIAGKEFIKPISNKNKLVSKIKKEEEQLINKEGIKPNEKGEGSVYIQQKAFMGPGDGGNEPSLPPDFIKN